MEHRFLNSDVPAPEGPHFEALGHAGSDHYVGLELFPNPGCAVVTYHSDEVVAHCPVTGQPDFYELTLQLREVPLCIESKSLKLWLRQFAPESGPGIFCEALAAYIRDRVLEAINAKTEVEVEDSQVTVQLVQKSRGGISITAVA